MDQRMQKYAELLIQYCLKLKKGQPLLIVGNVYNHSFIQKLKLVAENLGNTVSIIERDSYAERELYLTSSYEECIKSPMLDRHLYNEMALQGGAILSLSSPIPHIHDGVDPNLLGSISKELERRVSIFREKQMKDEVPWCIAAAANEEWAKEILPDSKNALEELWNTIFDICYVNEDHPEVLWEHYFDTLQERTKILNQMKIQSLHYKSSNGTDITFELPENYLFASAKDSDIVVNMPSLELFTTPKRDGVNGIVKSSKPLFHNGVKIINFWFQFEHGKVVDYDAEVGYEMLKQIVETDEGSHYLGELALVSYDSKINQSGVIFETTLYDENACCHLALGRGFPECFKDGLSKSLEELQQLGMNVSNTHVDFMIGTRDLEVVATLQDGSEVVLMKNGKLIF